MASDHEYDAEAAEADDQADEAGSDLDLDVDREPPAVDPYKVLGLERTATAAQVRTAYRKAALRSHPDKVAAAERAAAHGAFQAVAFAYAVLSDPARRQRYDATGRTDAGGSQDDDGFDWRAFYKAAYAEAVTADAIEAFAATYRQSAEERADVLAAYERHRGRMDGVFESVMLSDAAADDARFRALIDGAIADGAVRAYAAYTGETAAARRARQAAAGRERREAEAYAKELGVHDKLWGKGGKGGPGEKGSKGGKGGKEAGDGALAALIQKRQQDRAASFLDNLAAKYGAEPKKKKNRGKSRGRKRAGDEAEEEEEEDEAEEPSEEAFQAAAARLKASKGAGKGAATEAEGSDAGKEKRRAKKAKR